MKNIRNKKERKQRETSTRHMTSVIGKTSTAGITLIALVVTIVVLIILATVSINAVFSENGIIKQAQRASEMQANATKFEEEEMNRLAEQMRQEDIETDDNETEDNGPVTNPYEEEEWIMAWTCTNGTWSSDIQAGGTAEGDIVAKLYTTGNKITPPNITVRGTEYTFPEGDEYKLVIEGEGEMGVLMTTTNNTVDTITGAYAWQYSGLLYLGGYSDTCIIPYVTELIVCDGITNLGEYACLAGASLNSVKLGKDIKTIGQYAINTCVSLPSITIPEGVTSLGDNVFYGDSSLESIVLPSTLTSIGDQVFGDCTSLAKIKILTTDAINLIVDSTAFKNISDNSIIYVLSEEIKAKLDGTYDTAKTTVQVVTQEEMNSI